MLSRLRHSSLLLGASLVALTALRATDEPNYETQIRPILKEHCTHCHGEEEKLKGGVDLRLRRFMDGKTEDGAPMLTPGKPEQSALFTLIRAGEMPKKGKKMPTTSPPGSSASCWPEPGPRNSDVTAVL